MKTWNQAQINLHQRDEAFFSSYGVRTVCNEKAWHPNTAWYTASVHSYQHYRTPNTSLNPQSVASAHYKLTLYGEKWSPKLSTPRAILINNIHRKLMLAFYFYYDVRSSVDTDILLTPRSRLVTVGDRSFPVAGPRAGNDLPETVRAAPSLSSFKRLLKTFLFSRRYSWLFLFLLSQWTLQFVQLRPL